MADGSPELLLCNSCGASDWIIQTHCMDLHGYGFKCRKCNRVIWSGKMADKAKKRNPKHRAKHRSEGEMVCDWCGITETEARLMGHHFTIDHAEAEQFGGEDAFENTRPLCSACHYLKTALEFKTKGIRKLLNEDRGNVQAAG